MNISAEQPTSLTAITRITLYLSLYYIFIIYVLCILIYPINTKIEDIINYKCKLDDKPLSEAEFAKVKNDLSHATFYDAGDWLVGENGRVQLQLIKI